MHFSHYGRTKRKRPSKTRINERDMVVQGPGFGPGFDHGLGFFLKRDFFKVGGIRAQNRAEISESTVT